jgi:hypothetical protein
MEKEKKTLSNSPTIVRSQNQEIFLLSKNLEKIKKVFSQPL